MSKYTYKSLDLNHILSILYQIFILLVHIIMNVYEKKKKNAYMYNCVKLLYFR